MRPRRTDTLCHCGHPFVSHDHLRRGTDCAWCAPGACVRFATPALLERLRVRLGGADHGSSPKNVALVLVR